MTIPETIHSLSDDLVQTYETVCMYETPRRTPRAMRSFHHVLAHYLCWLDQQGLGVAEVDFEHAEAYQAHCATEHSRHGRPYSAGAVRNFIKAGCTCHRVLKLRGVVKDNPFTGIKYLSDRSQPIRNVLNEVQLGRLLEQLSQWSEHTIQGYRVHVVAELLCASGMRITEAASVSISDVHLSERRVWIARGKNGQARMAYLTDEACMVLELWIECGRKALPLRPQDDRLFGLSYAQLTNQVNRHLHAACQAVGLPIVTSHCFRHCLGYHLLRSGCDIRYIQAILGHEQIDSTKIYTQVDKDDLAEVLATHHPRALLHGGLIMQPRGPLKANQRRVHSR